MIGTYKIKIYCFSLPTSLTVEYRREFMHICMPLKCMGRRQLGVCCSQAADDKIK